jgi:hypothetical protein
MFWLSYIAGMHSKTVVFCLHLWLSIRLVTPNGCSSIVGICHVVEWNPWGRCFGSCGKQTQNRSRAICCPSDLPHKTGELCRTFCNVSEVLHQTRTCRVCVHGTPVSLNICQCHSGYKGKCCEGKIDYDCTIHFFLTSVLDSFEVSSTCELIIFTDI